MTISEKSLKEAMFKCAHVVPRRSALPALGGVRFEARGGRVWVCATDEDLFLTREVVAHVRGEGIAVVPARTLRHIAARIPRGEAVCLEARGEGVTLRAGSYAAEIACFSSDDFPQMKEPPSVQMLARVGTLVPAITAATLAASRDEARPLLTGVLVEVRKRSVRLVSTDSYRLCFVTTAARKVAGGVPRAAVVPARALSTFARLAGTRGVAGIGFSKEAVQLSVVGRFRLVGRLIEGEFPNYRDLMPSSYPNRLVADRAALLEAVKRVGLVAQVNTPVRLHLAGKVQLMVREAGVGDAQETLEGAAYSGEPMVVAFNRKYLIDGVNAVERERVVIEVDDPGKPAIMRGENQPEYLCLLMPVRLPA